ncbi:hypothetical protein AAVH_20613 [Aphelenchoides avenae]|nr:hypothetical protein AAVH_20613 [Aphelenchus avenae]
MVRYSDNYRRRVIHETAEELWEAVKDDVVREYQAEKREEVLKKVTFKRSVTQTTIERYCVRMPLHPPTKCDDIEVLEKRKRQATMEEYFEKKPQN